MGEKRKAVPQKVKKNILQATNRVNYIFLFFIIVHGIVFWCYDAKFLLYFSVFLCGSLLFAGSMLKRGNKNVYIATVFGGLFLFMVVVVICLGWEWGFQQYCIGITTSLIFTNFYLHREKKASRNIVYLTIGVVMTYLILRIWTYIHPSIYVIENKILVRGYYLMNSVLGFAFLVGYMMIFYNTACRLETELLEMANVDMLTGIFNRRKMHEVLKVALGRQEDSHFQNLVAMLDVDFFKNINDTYGHDVGDEVLVAIANILKELQDNEDGMHVCRWGGEEFLVFYENYRLSDAEMVEIFENLRKKVERTEIVHKNDIIKVTVTIGVAFCKKGTSVQRVICQADDNLYEGKRAGRNRVISS